MNKKEAVLKEFLQKLEASADKIVATQGYNQGTEKLKMVEELIKEQVIHANSRPAARQTR